MSETMHPARRARRWGDNDRHLGPFTFAFRKTWRPFAVILSSGSPDRECPGCCIRLQAFGATVICELPPIIKPFRQWVDTTGKAWAHGPGYWDGHPREYGFMLSGNHLSVEFGVQSDDSATHQHWGCFLPWCEWRQISNRVFNADGSMAADVALMPWDQHHQVIERVTRVPFAIVDFDGERIEVETYIEDRTWRLGTGWFRWLGYVAPLKHRRSLDIRFKSEVGPEKGSWKGGTLGHGIEMLPYENHEQAFRRYCSEEHRSKHRTFRIAFAEPAPGAHVGG